MHYSIKALLRSALAGLALATGASAYAEVAETSENRFVTKDTAIVSATPKETWLALISPGEWWSSQHTWSGDAANLRITPQAGGCFCEKIPEEITEDSFTLEGSVEHMRVIQAYPERALRLAGALGPLQSEPVTGVLTIALTEVDLPGDAGDKGTRIVWEYNVGGPMRYEIPVISKAVDGVMSLQLAGLAKKLGRVESPDEEPVEEVSADDEAVDAGEDASAKIEAEETLPQKEQAAEEPKAGGPTTDGPTTDGPSVDEAFDDLADPDEEPPVDETVLPRL